MSQVITKTQVSAGGVTFRRRGSRIEVALISVGDEGRWQLPKGLVDKGESNEDAAMREVREETGLETEMVAPLDKVEYWYYSTTRGERVRFHKFVHFYLLRYKSGNVNDHDHEVNEARWVEVDEAREMLAFKSEKKIIELARAMILA
jgi:8-oxo-dGTP pyrophosphatase MutT (NUDIX family)